jgi:hypothetical protein
MDELVKERIQKVKAPEAVRLFFRLLKILIDELQYTDDNPKLALTVPKDTPRIVANLNSRYVLVLNGDGALRFMIDKQDYKQLQKIIRSDSREEFTSKGVVDAYLVEYSLADLGNEEVLGSIVNFWLQSCKRYEPLMTQSNFRKFHNTEVFNIASDDSKIDAYLTKSANPLGKWIEQYKRLISGSIPDAGYNELYKWETIQHFQSNWTDNHTAANISDVLRRSFNKENNNLWSGQNYFPYRMIAEFAVKDPASVSSMFKDLYDEKKDLTKRIDAFQRHSEILTASIFPGKDFMHHQTDRAILLYLALRYPNKYYLYKSRMFQTFCELTDFWEKPNKTKNDKFSVLVSYNDMCGKVRELLVEDPELINLHKKRIPSTITFEDDLHVLTQDFIYAVATYLNKTTGEPYPGDPDTSNENCPMELNQIFFGPPGTGKTYHTINEAVKIADPDYYSEHEKDRDQLKERFRELLIRDWDNTKGQIAFCTFHQSFSYEDFVEGIKPSVTDDKRVLYEIADGILKKLCRLSEDFQKSQELKKDRIISWDEDTFKKASFYKLSLGDISIAEDNAIYDYCIAHNCIALGFGEGYDFSGLDEAQIRSRGKELELTDYAIRCLNLFTNYLKIGNYVIISKGNRYVRAIAKVSGNYKFDPDVPGGYNQTRRVEWIVKNESIPIDDVYDRKLTQQTIYKISESGIKKSFFVGGAQLSKDEEIAKDKNFVLVIDEINRGNVSSIFGELITLIERDKRSNGSEALEVILPYSKEPFSVPGNVYLVGTMNTADRSIEALDTALRRRFSFREMPSNSTLIRNDGKLKPNGKIGNLDVVDLLDKINARIEKLIDKNHKIGHSYFLEVTTLDDLKHVFKNKVIPLLEEYFFGDFGKIGLVLGDSFIRKNENDGFKFATFKAYDEDGTIIQDLEKRPVYEITEPAKWDFSSI